MEKQLSTKIIYQGNVVTLKEDVVECSNGLHTTRECVNAPGGVAILAIQDQQILLVKQYRYVVQEKTIEIPAGKIEPHEDLMVTASRELEEECGFSAETFTPLFTFYPTPGFCSEILHIFLAENLHRIENPKQMDEDEELTSFFIDLKKAHQMMMEGFIKDSKTMIAIQYAIHALKMR